VIHEFLHALGFFHMQSAHDRDKYIRIKTKNITPQNLHNFNKYSNRYISYYGTSYDYDSVMHYSAKAFSANGDDTIITLDPNYQKRIGKRLELSEGDIQRVNNMYRCGS
jgi:Astacin (Peptidase family M12A)